MLTGEDLNLSTSPQDTLTLNMKYIALLCLLYLLPVTSKAAAYWMEVKGSGRVNEPVIIQIIYGHIDEYSIRHRDKGKELSLTGEFKLSVLDQNGRSAAVSISQKEDCWEGTFTPSHDGVYRILGINDTHPVVDRSKTGGKNVKPVDYLCAEYRVGTGSLIAKPARLLDIVTSTANGIVTVKAFNNGKPAAADTKLRVFNPENWEKELTLNDKGEATFKTTMPGIYIIRQDWDDASAGTYQGVDYVSIRHRCNYSLLVQ
jgi:hypothetical protein